MKAVLSRDALGRVSGQTYYQGGSPTPGPNILPNPSMETVSGSDPNKPDKWDTNSWGTNTPVFTYLNEGNTGNRSVKTEVTSYTDGDAKWKFDQVAVTGNTTYTFKDYYKSNIETEVVVEYKHQNQTVSYDFLGFADAESNWTQTSHNFTTPATATHASVFHYVHDVGWLIIDDAEVFVSNTTGGQTVLAGDTVTRSQSGRIVSGTENGVEKEYTYDLAGRLTEASIGTDTYSYGYGTQDSSCASGTNANSGKNSNRTSQTINSTTTTFCYDQTDKLVSSSDATADDAQYDSHGNTTQIGSGSYPLQLIYDASDRNSGIEKYVSSGDGTGVYYGRDVENRINYRETTNIDDWNWTQTSQQWYGFTSPGGGASFIRDGEWDVVEKYLSLPGGVMLTIRPNETGNAQKTYSLPNLSGAVMATTNAAGTIISTYSYDPFGNKTSTNFPNNTASGSTLGWAGGAGRITEKDMSLAPIQMGARLYFPTLGRFAQVDPVPGGNANDYVYPADPINSNDFSGAFAIPIFNNQCIWCIASNNIFKPVAQAAGMSTATYRPPPRPAAPKQAAPARNNSTALPAAQTNPLTGALSKAKNAVSNAWNNGYVNIGVGYASMLRFVPVGGNIGAKVSKDGVHIYAGPCLAYPPGASGSITFSPSPPSTGWGRDYSFFIPGRNAGGSLSNNGSFEPGFGIPGVGVCQNYTW
jgi:RHS repeat-associated protein